MSPPSRTRSKMTKAMSTSARGDTVVTSATRRAEAAVRARRPAHRAAPSAAARSAGYARRHRIHAAHCSPAQSRPRARSGAPGIDLEQFARNRRAVLVEVALERRHRSPPQPVELSAAASAGPPRGMTMATSATTSTHENGDTDRAQPGCVANRSAISRSAASPSASDTSSPPAIHATRPSQLSSRGGRNSASTTSASVSEPDRLGQSRAPAPALERPRPLACFLCGRAARHLVVRMGALHFSQSPIR